MFSGSFCCRAVRSKRRYYEGGRSTTLNHVVHQWYWRQQQRIWLHSTQQQEQNIGEKKNERITNGIVEENKKTFLKEGTWVGRVKTDKGDYKVVTLDKSGKLRDLTGSGIWSVAALLQHKNPTKVVTEASKEAPVLKEDLGLVLKNSIVPLNGPSGEKHTTFVSPHDLSSIKAAGVVFVKSLLERVVEEQAKGDPDRAHVIRKELSSTIGKQLDQVKPGSKEALELLRILTEEKGVSRHYLEVGLGPDAELFTKAQPMSTLGFGAHIGINPQSTWNNPEPEIVVVVNKHGSIVGSTLGNDVNLRDWEGRSALLLSRAKDVNGSCMLGPLIRLFDNTFSLDHLRSAVITLSITGEDGYKSEDFSSMKEIGRDLNDLVGQAFKAHQYPDGLFLMTGTMFAPVEDRDPINFPKLGFTHHKGDHVLISSPMLGNLYNIVNYSNIIPTWDFGSVHFFEQLLAQLPLMPTRGQ